jgi:putative heme-binding domain-containing protein
MAPLALLLSLALLAQDLADATWIWGSWADELVRPAAERCAFRRDFELAAAPRSATLVLSVDNSARVLVNGRRAGFTNAWETATAFDVTALVAPGANRLEIRARNAGGPAGLLAALALVGGDGARGGFVSDAAWETAAAESDGPTAAWAPAREIAPYGAPPWNAVPIGARVIAGERASDKRFEVPAGFRVAEAYLGADSYVSLALDERGRAFVGSEGGAVLVLDDLDHDGFYDAEAVFTERVAGCQGLAWKDGALYCVGDGPDGMGLYRVPEAQPRAPELIGGLTGNGEHGPHGVVVGPDGALYLTIGNHATFTSPRSPASPYRAAYEGHLLPRYRDPRGHAVDVDAPGGIVVRVELATDGAPAEWQVLAGGLRNAYDLAFLSNGDLFTFDSDMEWDIGLPWYREVRLLHVVPGGEYGWRTGSAKWPAWYPDSLPPACEVGRGSPCGMVAYGGAMFPHRYTDAVLAADWSRGRILAFFPAPVGASYQATHEELVLGRPLNATDLAVAADGSLLIATGGRGTEGALWRLSYAGERGDDAPRGFAKRLGRVAGFAFTGGPSFDGGRVERFAAMLGLEREVAAGRTDLEEVVRITHSEVARRMLADGLIAFARGGLARTDARSTVVGIDRALSILASLSEQDPGPEGIDGRRVALRAIDLFLQDDDAPEPSELGELGVRLLALYPTRDRDADAELAMLLAYLAPDGAVDALVGELQDSMSRADGLHLLYCLRCVESGWTDRTRAAVADWLRAASSAGGESYGGYVDLIRGDLRRVFGPEHAALLDKAAAAPGAPAKSRQVVASARSLDATLEFLAGALESDRRSLDEGALVFADNCARCHAYHGVGHGTSATTLQGADGTLGPDLAGAAGRYSRADLLDAIARPSRVVPEAYRATDAFLWNGTVVSGLVVADTDASLVLAQSDGTRVAVAKDEIDERRESPLSIMPDGLLEALTLEEIADLVFYLSKDEPRAAPEASTWTPLFDGKTLEGWRFDPALWSVRDGVIVGKGEGLAGSSFLIGTETYGDFALEYDLRVVAGNSGLQFRSTPFGDHGLHGYQADAGEVYWGSLYEEGGRGMLNLADAAVWRPAVRLDDWNHYCVQARGDRIAIELNGAVTTDVRDAARAEGRIGFQLHAGSSEIRLRAIRVRRL